MTAQHTVISIFPDHSDAIAALKALKEAGLSDQQLGFVVRRQQDRREGAKSVMRGIVGGILGGVDMLILPFVGPADAINMLEGTLPAAEDAIDHLLAFGSRHQHQPTPETHLTPAEPSQPPEQATLPTDSRETADSSGIAAGGLAGGVVGAAGSALLIPGIGPAIAGGVLGMALVGAAVGGLTGGFLGAIMRMGVPEDRAHYYEQEFKAGHVVMTIKPANDAQEQLIYDILHRHHAHGSETHTA